MLPEPSKNSVPADEKGTVLVDPPTNWPNPVFVNGGLATEVPVPEPVVFVLVVIKAPGIPFPIAVYE